MRVVILFLGLMLVSRFAFSQVGPVYNFNFYNNMGKSNEGLPLAGTSELASKEKSNELMTKPETATTNSTDDSRWGLSLGKMHAKLAGNEDFEEYDTMIDMWRISVYVPMGKTHFYFVPHFELGSMSIIDERGSTLNSEWKSQMRGYGVSLVREFFAGNVISLKAGAGVSASKGIYTYGESDYNEFSQEVRMSTYFANVSPVINLGNLMIAGNVNYQFYNISEIEVTSKNNGFGYGLELGLRI